MTSFNDFGLRDPIVRALADLNYTTPTDIQSGALPVALSGRDLIACAQTGSGKTAVFVLPFLQRLVTQSNGGQRSDGPRCLVLVPTRELAIQVEAAFRSYGRNLRFRTTAVYGGVGYGGQLEALRRGVDVLVATPGRLLDHLDRGSVRLDTVRYLVLDEADRMLDLGFLPQVRRVLTQGRIPARDRQTLLFSATMPPQIAELAADYLSDPERVEAHAPATAVDTIDQRLYPVAQEQKADLLARLLRDEPVESALIFARTRRRADKLSRVLNAAGLANEAIHSDVPQRRREQALGRFRRGELKFLVATDVASRGLDIPHISHVVNHDVPDMAEDYIHRIGRTGRAGRSGVAITLYSNTDEALWQAVETLTDRKLEPSRVPGFAYQLDASEPLLTRRQQADRNRAQRLAGGTVRSRSGAPRPSAARPAPTGRPAPGGSGSHGSGSRGSGSQGSGSQGSGSQGSGSRGNGSRGNGSHGSGRPSPEGSSSSGNGRPASRYGPSGPGGGSHVGSSGGRDSEGDRSRSGGGRSGGGRGGQRPGGRPSGRSRGR